MMAEIQSDTVDALEVLRDLARGIYPPVLADQGLRAALDHQIRKAPMPVELFADDVARYPQETEAAVYFCCLEALQNVAKYAMASKTTVRLDDRGDSLAFAVSDDGTGFDTKRTAKGMGLQGMADRLEALGGSLQIRSSPGRGTVIAGWIPTRTLVRDSS